MTVRELAAALAALPERYQDWPVSIRSEEFNFEVVAILNSFVERRPGTYDAVELAVDIPCEPHDVIYPPQGHQPADCVVNAPACPKCAATMQGGVSLGPSWFRWECRACGYNFVPLADGD